jgi:hypothetical protein
MHTMKTNLTKLGALSFTVSFFLLLTSCGSSDKPKDNAEDLAAAEFDAAEQELENEIDKVIHDLPAPSEVPFLLEATGADFRAEFVNDLSRIESYLTSNDKSALNLGIYAADIGYLSSYNQAQEALDYMEGCQKMADKIGIASAFDMSLLARFEKSIGNNDSLALIINEAIKVAEEKLEAGDRLTMAALVLAGSFVEGLYISTQVIEQYPADQLSESNRDLILEPLMRIVLNQKMALLDLISVLKHVEQDETIANVISEMNILRFHYEELAELEQKINNNEGGVVLHQHDLQKLAIEIERVRKDITG